MSAQVTYNPPADIDARRSRSLVIGVGALVLCAVGFFINRDQFFRAWLIGYMLWLGVALGSMGVCGRRRAARCHCSPSSSFRSPSG